MYHSGETEDVAQVVNKIIQREGDVPIAAIGFSLGGNVLLKWLGESGSSNPLKACVAVSVPFELGKSVDRINLGFSKIYQKRLLNNLYNKIQLKLQQQILPIPPLSKVHTLRDFDEQVTAPLHGFYNAEAYYTNASCRQYLHKIAIPTLIIQAEDDPFMTKDLLPQQSELSNQIIFELTKHGGHVGFVSGCIPWHPEYWLEKRAPQFLSHHLPLTPLILKNR
jgi:predicted alpha/beta-fold hydrolase